MRKQCVPGSLSSPAREPGNEATTLRAELLHVVGLCTAICSHCLSISKLSADRSGNATV